jgi:ERCC4-type nuclease
MQNTLPAQEPIRVEVDDREGPGPVAEALSAIPGVEVAVQRLGLGDYRVDGRLLVERKTLMELAA